MKNNEIIIKLSFENADEMLSEGSSYMVKVAIFLLSVIFLSALDQDGKAAESPRGCFNCASPPSPGKRSRARKSEPLPFVKTFARAFKAGDQAEQDEDFAQANLHYKAAHQILKNDFPRIGGWAPAVDPHSHATPELQKIYEKHGYDRRENSGQWHHILSKKVKETGEKAGIGDDK